MLDRRARAMLVGALTVLAGALVGPPADAGGPQEIPPCKVTNRTQSLSYKTHDGAALTQAIAEAVAGDELRVRDDSHCRGHFTIDKDLQLLNAHGDQLLGAQLNANKHGTPLTVTSGAHVTIRGIYLYEGETGGLVVEDGAFVDFRHGGVVRNANTSGSGGGVVNHGNLRLVDVGIFGNAAAGDGGGIYNTGTLISPGQRRIEQNVATGRGGGVFNSGDATIRRTDVINNSAASGGGIYNEGTLTLQRVTIEDNEPDDCVGC